MKKKLCAVRRTEHLLTFSAVQNIFSDDGAGEYARNWLTHGVSCFDELVQRVFLCMCVRVFVYHTFMI